MAAITTRGQRACMVCSIIQPRDTFVRRGCPNCEEVLNLTGHRDAVDECTSQVFEGYIALADPSQSWVAKWQRLDGYKPGTYAVKVVGNLPEEVIQSLEENGIKYIPRDGTAAEEEGAA